MHCVLLLLLRGLPSAFAQPLLLIARFRLSTPSSPLHLLLSALLPLLPMPPTGPSGIAVVVGGNVVVAGARVVDAHTILDFPFGVVVRTALVVAAIAATVVDVAASACLFRRGNCRWCCHRAGSWRLLLTTLALAPLLGSLAKKSRTLVVLPRPVVLSLCACVEHRRCGYRVACAAGCCFWLPSSMWPQHLRTQVLHNDANISRESLLCAKVFYFQKGRQRSFSRPLATMGQDRWRPWARTFGNHAFGVSVCMCVCLV